MNYESEFTTEKWRLLISPPAQGVWNMAVDEAILEFVNKRESLSTLRLYAWKPPCLSLGYSQPITDVDMDAITERGWDITRRMTGGRAILHTDELTYAVIGSETEPRLKGGVLESYRIISRALLKALNLLGVPAVAREPILTEAKSIIPEENDHLQNPVCFEVPSNYEITVNGKKLVGSAQARRKKGVLQHGSIPLEGDITRIMQVLNYQNEGQKIDAGSRIKSRATTIEKVLGMPINWETAADAVQKAFSEVLRIEFIDSQLDPAEIQHADLLVKEKYHNKTWITRV